MQAVGYMVLKSESPDTSEPYLICKVTVFFRRGGIADTSVTREIARHVSYNMAKYWATMLNEGKETEESVCFKIDEAKKLGPRSR